MHVISSEDLETLLSALYVAVPSGGGSDAFSLYQRLSRETGIVADLDQVEGFGRNVVAEYLESIS